MRYLFTIVPFLSTRMLMAAPFGAWQADTAYHKGNWQEARSGYETLVERRPHDMQALYNLGKTAYKQKDFRAAEQAFKKVAQSQSVTTDQAEQAYFNLGDTGVELGQYQPALDAYMKALELNGHNEHTKKRIEYVKSLMEEKQQQEDKKDKQDKQEQKSRDNKTDSEQQQQDQGDKKDGQQPEAQERSDNGDNKQQGEQSQAQSTKDKAKKDNNTQAQNGAHHTDETNQTKTEDTKSNNGEQQRNNHKNTQQPAPYDTDQDKTKQDKTNVEDYINKSIAQTHLNDQEKAILKQIEEDDKNLRQLLVKAYVQDKDQSSPTIHDYKNW
jgi:Ca-activated chloride channel homolog